MSGNPSYPYSNNTDGWLIATLARSQTWITNVFGLEVNVIVRMSTFYYLYYVWWCQRHCLDEGVIGYIG